MLLTGQDSVKIFIMFLLLQFIMFLLLQSARSSCALGVYPQARANSSRPTNASNVIERSNELMDIYYCHDS